MIEISGDIDEIRFRNDDNGYTVLVLDVEGDPVICAGNFPPVSEGTYLCLSGEYMVHPKFGKQFKVSSVKCAAPDTLDGITRYLGSGLIKGIGPKTALAIVEKFGLRTFDIIQNNAMMLSSVKGVSKEKARDIYEGYQSMRSAQDALVFLQGHNISLNMALKIYKEYGENTVAKVKSNPYMLIEDVDGIGFLTADRIAQSVGIGADSEFRIRAGIIFVLKDSSEKNGNTYLPKDELITEASRLLSAMSEIVSDQIDELVFLHKLKLLNIDGASCIMTVALFRIEKNAAVSLARLIQESSVIVRDCAAEIAQFEISEGITFHQVQKDAITKAVSGGVTVITGGPGTGKTTIIKCILYILDAMNSKYVLMAPTGRAAKRLSESTMNDASTIHRALMLTKGRYDNAYDGEKLNVNAVIVDEFSMVDIYLFNTLLGRLPSTVRFIIVGDSDQLPSVGAGNVLKDIMDSDVVPVVRLTHIYRQGKESLITENAHKINGGEMPDLKRTDSDFFYTNAISAQDIAEVTVALAAKRIPSYLSVDPYRVQVLCPMKNGLAGSNNINKQLQETLNGNQKQQLVTEDFTYKLGDKVMHIVNNYDLEWERTDTGYEQGNGVFNGDMGMIMTVNTDSGELEVLFEDGRKATYTADIRNQLLPAYAITVHKSQGSEFDAVIMPITGGNPVMMTRNLLYTAITRAKKCVVLVGEEYFIKRMIENNFIAKRYSALKQFIQDGVNESKLLFDEDF